MAAAGIDDKKIVTVFFKRELHVVNDGVLRIRKVDCDDSAVCAGDLIHQSARFVKIVILRPLSGFCDCDGIDFFVIIKNATRRVPIF